MKYILRPYVAIALALMLGAVSGLRAQSGGISQILQKVDPLLSHNSQGYLGVLVSDVDNDSATKLKLKEVRGALITLIDHDAPAGQVGLRINDVVLELNGQRVEGAEQFGRMLRDLPAGRKINLLISRDGNSQPIDVQLCDRKVMEQDVWNKLGRQNQGGSSAPTLGMLTGTGDAGLPGFHMPLFGSTLNVGAMVEPLTRQTADFLGIQSGILIKQVARKSEAATAGFKEHDVILKVANESITTTADWDRALRSNQDKPVQVTILRDGKQMVLNLQVDSKRKKSEVEYKELFPGLLPDGPRSEGADLAARSEDEACGLFAELNKAWTADAQTAAEKLRSEMDEFRRSFNPDEFKVDPAELENFRQEMEQFRRNFNPDAFRIDPKQMEDLNREMEQMRKSMPELFQFNQKKFDELRREMEQVRSNIAQQV